MMQTYRNAMTKNSHHFSRIGAFCILLALPLTACDDRDSDELDSTAAERAGEFDTAQGMTHSDGGARMMTVSVTGSGTTVPKLQAGRTTFTVDNANTRDCVLTLIRKGDAEGMGAGTMTDDMGQDNTRDPAQNMDGALGEDDEMSSDATDAQARTGADTAGTLQGQLSSGRQNNRVTAGPETTVTMDLEPGLYEVSCSEAQDTAQQGSNRQSTTQQDSNQGTMSQQVPDTPMLVMVTEETTLGTGTRGAHGTTQPQETDPSGEDTPGTDNE